MAMKAQNLAATLVSEAVEAASKGGVDFNRYDNNKDGVVDGIIVIHSGPGGEESASSQYVWSHMSYVSEPAGGVYVEPYIITPETRNSGYGRNGMVGLGIFAHEFGHLLGLPDLYDTSEDSEGIGEWGLMGSGNWVGMENSPAGFTAWSKEQMGWIKPTDITSEFKEFGLNAASENAEAYRINTANPNEYFLLENRQFVGIDKELNGHGLAIWHINTQKTSLYPGDNSVNADPSNKGVGLQEADGSYDLDNSYNRGDNSDLYPAGYYKLSLFDYSTKPSSDLNEKYDASKATGISIGNVQEKDNRVTFTYKKQNTSSGNDCNDAAIAIAGRNFTPKLDYYFTYTMPESGTLSLSVDDPALVVGGTVYRSCEEVDSGDGDYLYLDGGNRSEKTYKVGFVEKGTTYVFQWEYNLKGDVDGVESFYFDLNVETDGVAVKDSLALVAMYNQMGGKDWSNQENWLKKPVASWSGVSVSKGRVVSLTLPELQKSFPEEFYDLTALEALSLQSSDSLTGLLDERVGNFINLEDISINTQGLEINFISKLDGTLAKLKNLNIVAYKVNGSLPASISNMKLLENLSIQAQSFKSAIPANIGKIPNLVSLALVGNLSGAIPESLSEAKKLKFLDLSFNQLSGPIPASLSKLNKLEYLNVQSNQLTGNIPAEIFNLPYLTSFYADHNQLESIPENLFASASLEFVDISYNNISGSLPSSASGKNIMDMYAYLNNNKLTGAVPVAIEKISFAYLDVSNNQLEGTLPQISYTDGLDISDNNFTGLPDLNPSDDYSYQSLYCRRNKLSFDDIVPNLPLLLCGDCEYGEQAGTEQYSQFDPQDSVDLKVSEAIGNGDSYTIALDIDKDIKDNTYAWYRNGKLVETINKNELLIENFTAEQAGKYYCLISNARIKGFNLYYGGIALSIKDDKQDQQITLVAVSGKRYNDASFRLETTTNGATDIAYKVIEGPVQMAKDTVMIEGTGNVKIRAYHPGNATYNPAEAFVEFNIAKADQQIVYTQPESIIYGQDEFLLDISSSSSLPVLLTLQKGNITLDGKLITISGAGEVSIMASQEGNSNYDAADAVEITFNVAKASQQISMDTIGDQIFGAPTFPVNAVSSQKLPVTLEALTGNIKVDSNKITILGAGPAGFKAIQPGNEDIEAAEEVVVNFNVAKGKQTLYFQQISDQVVGTPPFELQAYSNKELPVSYEIVDGKEYISLVNNQVTVLKPGSVYIEAYQEGTENYEAAEPMVRGFTVIDTTKQPQTLIIQTEIPDTVTLNGQQSYEFEVGASSELLPDVQIEGPANYDGKTLTFQGEGSVKVIVSQQGNDDFNAAPTVVKEYLALGEHNAAKAQQKLSYQAIGNKVYGAAPFVIEATASSALPLSYTVQGPAEVDGNQVTITGVGTVTIGFFQAGNDTFHPTDTTVVSFEVAQAPQAIDFEVEPINDTVFYLSAKSSAQLPVAYSVANGVGYISSDTLYVNENGKVTITASQPGNINYLAAPSVDRTVEVKIVTGLADDIISLISIYPNPSSSVFYLEAEGMAMDTHVYVYSTDGRKISKKAWKGKLTDIDLSNQPEGVYFVRFYHEDQWFNLRLVHN